MTDRDRLIELLEDTLQEWECDVQHETLSQIAEHLNENGVIVPPVNIGDSLWTIHYNRPKEWKVVYIGFNGEEWHINAYWYKDKDNFATRQIQDKFIDELFYRSKEEVEKELKNRAKFK